MKKIGLGILILLLFALLCTGCNKDIEESRTDFRVLFSSDVHCTTAKVAFGVSNVERMQLWVDSILKEHEEHPIDLLIINGDVSYDYWSSGGSYRRDGVSTSQIFFADYVSQLPEEIAVIRLPGNHEQYTNEKWMQLAGNERQCTYVLGKNVFVMPDTYRSKLDPDYDTNGEYTPIDVEYVNKQVKAYPKHDIYIISHNIDIKQESQEFKELVAKHDNVRGLFSGHTHYSSVINLGSFYKDKVIAQIGNFSFIGEKDGEENFWGFRDLVITADGATSRYIRVESNIMIDSRLTHIERKLFNIVEYDFDSSN